MHNVWFLVACLCTEVKINYFLHCLLRLALLYLHVIVRSQQRIAVSRVISSTIFISLSLSHTHTFTLKYEVKFIWVGHIHSSSIKWSKLKKLQYIFYSVQPGVSVYIPSLTSYQIKFFSADSQHQKPLILRLCLQFWHPVIMEEALL